MTSSQKSTLTALGVFALTSVVVLGGMTWATAASFELAKKTVSEEYLTRVHRALWQTESRMKGILNSEASRPYTDYVDYHMVHPVAAISADGGEVDAERVILRSPIAMSGPPYEWIDLYFQVDHDGIPSSPQFAEEGTLWTSESTGAMADSARRAQEAWSWFKWALPTMDFRNRVSEALKRDRATHGAENEREPMQVVRVAQRPASLKGAGRGDWTSGRSPRRASAGGSGVGYVPPELCVPPQIAAGNIGNIAVAIDAGFEQTAAPPAPIRISLSPFAPAFWVESGPGRPRKLAFVREGSADAEVFYQGFIGDWDRLKPDLLRSLEDVFPQADLEPVANDQELDADESEMKLHELPARLRVPDLPGGADAAAWRSMRAVLLVTWAAAAAVLVVAGWGVRNLMALTERRMQFAYAVTHELRTPLTTFRLYSDMLSAGLVPDTSKQEYLDTLNRESQRLSSLVEAVLEYARLENHKVRLNVTTTDAASLLRVLGETVQKRCTDNDVEAQARNAMPDAHPIRTDVNLVNQITAVLVDNACRHARGSRSPKLLVQLGGDNGQLYLDVVDSGPGIDLSDARKIFRPFRRGRDAEARARGGIGLGLALARNWAELLGGRLDLVARHHAQYGGAHFRLSIPADAPTT